MFSGARPTKRKNRKDLPSLSVIRMMSALRVSLGGDSNVNGYGSTSIAARALGIFSTDPPSPAAITAEAVRAGTRAAEHSRTMSRFILIKAPYPSANEPTHVDARSAYLAMTSLREADRCLCGASPAQGGAHIKAFRRPLCIAPPVQAGRAIILLPASTSVLVILLERDHRLRETAAHNPNCAPRPRLRQLASK